MSFGVMYSGANDVFVVLYTHWVNMPDHEG